MGALDDALLDAGGLQAPRDRTAQLRVLLAAELDRSAGELAKKRAGYGAPVVVGFAGGPGEPLRVALPVDPALRADPEAIGDFAWLVTAAAVGALNQAGATGDVLAGEMGGHLVLEAPGAGDPELAALAFDESVAGVDRLRARAVAVPGHVVEAADLREPIGDAHPLRVAVRIARLGGDPADPASVESLEEAVLTELESASPVARPHEDPDPARRIARRILQRLNGMGKWGGYHTEFVHLARGFAGNERALAEHVGEALVAAGLLSEKPSVGQRHVFLNPRRAAEIHALIDRGEVPPGLELPAV